MNPSPENLVNIVDCTLYQTQESEFGRKIDSFIDEMRRLFPGKIRTVRDSEASGLPAVPCFKISRQGSASVVYAALPSGGQLPVFFKALEWIARNISPDPGFEPATIASPAEIQVLISETCPHCPKMVETVIHLAAQHPWITPCIIDAGRFPEIAQKYGIQSVPASVVDQRLVLLGDITADRLKGLLEIRGTPKFETEVVLALIEGRRIPEAAECLLHEAGRQVILEMVQDSDFSKRLSALVVIEKALDVHPDVVQAMAPSFAALLSNGDPRIRGDIADLLGKIGNMQTIAQLQPLTADPDPDVAEISAEAIAELKKRFS